MTDLSQIHSRRTHLRLLLASLLTFGGSSEFLLSQISAPHAPEFLSDEVLKRADEYSADWLMYAKNYYGHRFSALNQINRGNASRLAPKWSFSFGVLGSQQCTPLVHRGIMYVTTTRGRFLQATLRSVWRF